MKINWFGQSCFYITINHNKQEKTTLLIDPFSSDIGLRLPKVSADILLVTHYHSDHSNIGAVAGSPSTGSGKTPFLIDGPGEYEIKNIFIKGIPAFHDNSEGKERGATTIYRIEASGFKICHLGDLGQKELTSFQVEAIGNIDVLMIPVGGVFTVSAKETSKIISQIEPKVVIPMHYKIPKLKIKLNELDEFLKAMGQKPEKIETVSAFVLKMKNLPEKETEIVVMKP